MADTHGGAAYQDPTLPLLVLARHVAGGTCGTPLTDYADLLLWAQITVDVPKDAYYLDFVFV